MANQVVVTDGKEYENTHRSDWLVSVISGTPVLEFSMDDFATSNVIDLTTSSTYPLCVVDMFKGKFRFTLSGAVVHIEQNQ